MVMLLLWAALAVEASLSKQREPQEPPVKAMREEMVVAEEREVAVARLRLGLLALEQKETELVAQVAQEQHHPTQALRLLIQAAAAAAATTETQVEVEPEVLAAAVRDTVLALAQEPQAQ